MGLSPRVMRPELSLATPGENCDLGFVCLVVMMGKIGLSVTNKKLMVSVILECEAKLYK